MKDYQTKDLFDLFDGRGTAPPDIPEMPVPAKKDTAPQGEERKRKRPRPRPQKKNGVFTLPVYKAAYDAYKECMFRFRKVPGDGKAIAREVTGNLKRIMVDIELVHWQVRPKTILPATFDLVLETIITIRAMKDFGDLSTKDFAIISQYTAELSRNMRVWSDFHNASTAGQQKEKE